MWSEEEVSDAMNRTKGLPCSLTGVTVRAIMTRAVELAAARGGTMTAATLSERFSWLEYGHRLPLADLREHIAAQGATVSTLQAKVEELEKALERYRNPRCQREECKRERKRVDELESEVERLKAIVMPGVGWKERAITAESRLAAIRERGNNKKALLSRAVGGLLQTVRWVLEGDASNPSMPSNGSGEEHVAVPVLPGDFALSCPSCGDVKPHRWKPSPEAGDFWRCSECGEPSKAGRYPCSATCTHDDAATPGHPERVNERSEAVTTALSATGLRRGSDGVARDDYARGHHTGSEAMRAAVEAWARGYFGDVPPALKDAMDGV